MEMWSRVDDYNRRYTRPKQESSRLVREKLLPSKKYRFQAVSGGVELFVDLCQLAEML